VQRTDTLPALLTLMPIAFIRRATAISSARSRGPSSAMSFGAVMRLPSTVVRCP
jgi:hypothetical protein